MDKPNRKGEKDMSEFEIPFRLENDYGDMVLLEKYGDKYSVCSAQEGKDGGVYKKWCYPQRRVDGKNVPADKGIPMKVTLGSRAQAVSILHGMLAALATPVDNPDPDGKQVDDDIPF